MLISFSELTSHWKRGSAKGPLEVFHNNLTLRWPETLLLRWDICHVPWDICHVPWDSMAQGMETGGVGGMNSEGGFQTGRTWVSLESTHACVSPSFSLPSPFPRELSENGSLGRFLSLPGQAMAGGGDIPTYEVETGTSEIRT